MLHTLLLRPPARTPSGGGLRVPPLGLAYLAAVLRAQGRRVTVLDALGEQLSWEAMTSRVAALQPDVLGLSAMTPVRDVAHRAARLLRAHVKAVVLGGPHPTAVGKQALTECEALDFLIPGEGEASLPLLLDAPRATWLPDFQPDPRHSGGYLAPCGGGTRPGAGPGCPPLSGTGLAAQRGLSVSFGHLRPHHHPYYLARLSVALHLLRSSGDRQTLARALSRARTRRAGLDCAPGFSLRLHL